MLDGIDLSHHNATPPTFAPYAFASFRVSFGRGTHGAPEADTSAELHAARMRATRPDCVGIATHWLNLYEPREQASMLLTREAIVGVGAWGLAIDVEDLPDHPPFPKAPYARVLLDALEGLSVTARVPLVYGSGSYLAQMFAEAPVTMREVAKRARLWLADWSAPYTIPQPWNEITVLQDKGAKPGGFDHDVFAGGAEELRAVLGLTVGPLPPSHAHGMAARGAIGPDVRELQQRLNANGAALRVDGIFGTLTEAAVRGFQRLKGLHVDGIVGPATWEALDPSS